MSTKYRRHVVHNDLHQVISTKFTQMTLGMPYYDVLVLVTFSVLASGGLFHSDGRNYLILASGLGGVKTLRVIFGFTLTSISFPSIPDKSHRGGYAQKLRYRCYGLCLP